MTDIKRLRSEGLQVLERARPIPADDSADAIDFMNHGGIAIVAPAIVAPTNVRLAKLRPEFDPSTFEHLCARISCIALDIYGPDSEHVTQQFFREFSKLLTYLATLSSPIIITGDINIRLDRPDDPMS